MQQQIQYIPHFFVKQKIAMTVNRFEVLSAGPDGQPGALICFAEQKRLAMREQVTFFSDAGKSRPVFGFKARSVMDLAGTYDVLDEFGNPLATFKKDFASSLLRTTYDLQGPGYEAKGQERNFAVALLRRFSELDFLPVDFDYVDASGNTLVSIERQWSLRDKYSVDVPDPKVDFRVAAALAVAMDVLIGR